MLFRQEIVDVERRGKKLWPEEEGQRAKHLTNQRSVETEGCESKKLSPTPPSRASTRLILPPHLRHHGNYTHDTNNPSHAEVALLHHSIKTATKIPSPQRQCRQKLRGAEDEAEEEPPPQDEHHHLL